MNPEKARELRDGHPRQRPAPFLPQPGTYKHRELHFDPRHPDQIERARSLLCGLDGMNVEPGSTPNSLSVGYELRDYTLDGLELALIRQGFHFDYGLVRKLQRVIIRYTEETQLRNLRVPQRLIKKSQDVYSKVWDRHLHGDHDDTPPDLRQDH